jgi:hypothetical protein
MRKKRSILKFRMQVPDITGRTRMYPYEAALTMKVYNLLEEQYPAVSRNKFMSQKNKFIEERDGQRNYLVVTVPVFDGKGIIRKVTF